jgi:ribosomal protein L37AE/L43A
MPRYRVVHQQTGETWEVESTNADKPREIIGWPAGDCKVKLVRQGPFAEIEPPKVAKQITPPKPGSSHICPDCTITMVENFDRGELWWQCPACDLLYHEWENQYYRADQL